MTDDPVLQAEERHLELARTCLAQMRRSAEGIADYGVDELASQALGALRAQRLRALDADPDAPPFFGRIDRDRDDGAPGVETFHLGRRHVRDDAGDPVVIDWRAPISRAFYRATPADRMGVRLRRRFGFAGGTLTSFEDEHLDAGESLGLASDLLRQEIERPRVGPMRDIVATIQPDQDDLVRLDLDSSVCVQGAPGTGKTAVGLHRAAYLLYTYPERLRRSGVLVIGPNRAFLHYIGQVLPSLGEVGIEQATVGDLVGVPQRPADEPLETQLRKADVRMADVLRRAVLTHVAKPTEDVVAIVGTKRYRVGAHHVRRYVDDARRGFGDSLRWTAARDRLRLQIAEDVRRQREDAGGAPTDAETARVARSPQVRAAVDDVWPPLTPAAVLARLYGDEEFRRRCTPTWDDAERDLLARPAPRSLRSVRWSAADAVLLDELGALIDGVPLYAHVVVDEAQDLSPMQCRVVGRRARLGSVTVLGDLAQATTPWAPGDWAVSLAHLGHEGAVVRPLTAGYRVPGEVLVLANRLLPHIASGVPPATSVRAGEDSLHIVGRATLVDEVRRCLAEPGTVGLIAADAEVDALATHLLEAGIAVAQLAADESEEDAAAADDARLVLVPASAAKGLEYDSVVVVEPAAIVAGEPSRAAGLRRLYVVLTRAVSRLVIAHDDALPRELADGSA